MAIVKNAISLVFLLFYTVVFAQQEIVFTEANDFYNKGEYNKAIELYQKVLKNKQHSAELYFNLANAYYKIQEIGQSVYYYEKALELSPLDKDIQNNYAFAKQNRIDVIEVVPEGVLKRFYKKLMGYPVNLWAYVSIIGSFLFVIGFVLFYLSRDPFKRKLLFGLWVVSVLTALISVVIAFSANSFKKSHIYGVLLVDEIAVQSEPNLRSEKLFKLHVGTKVQVLESVKDWSKIILKDGKSGWITIKSYKKL